MGGPRESVAATPAFLLEKLCFRLVQIPPFVVSWPLRRVGCSNPPSTQVPRTFHGWEGVNGTGRVPVPRQRGRDRGWLSGTVPRIRSPGTVEAADVLGLATVAA